MRRLLRSRLLPGAVFLALAMPAAAQTIIYARVGALGGDGSCGLPYGTIAAALADAKTSPAPTEIRLAGGTYSESGLVIDFSDVTLKGGYPSAFPGCPGDAAIEASRDIVANVTTINAGQVDRHLSITPQVDGTGNFLASNTGIVIDGITFVGGRPSGAASLSGGSIYITNSSARLTNDIFRNNGTAGFYANGTYANGGAVYLVGYPTPTSSDFRAAGLDIQGTLFESNQTGPANSGAGIGGAIYAADFNFDGTVASRQTTLGLTNNVFRTNTANGSGDLNAATQCPDIYADANGDGICDDVDGDLFCDPPDGVGDANDSCPLTDPATGNGVPPNRCHIFALGGAVAAVNVNGTWQGNTFEGNRARANQTASVNFSGNGGAIYVTSSQTASRAAAPVITNNLFTNNTADAGLGSGTGCGWDSAWGGAAYLLFFRGQLRDNSFDSNTATATGNGGDNTAWGGGAFVIPNGSPTISGNDFTGNQSVGGTGSNSAYGGGMAVDDFRQLAASPILTNNTFTGNSAAGNVQLSAYGGGLAIATTGAGTLIASNVMQGNNVSGPSDQTPQVAWGGGMWGRLENPQALIADNVISGNSASAFGGVGTPSIAGLHLGPALILANPDAAPRIQNNLIAGNQGVGASVFGFSFVYNMTTYLVQNGAEMYHNTIADNDQSGLFLSLANSFVLDSNIIWNNDASNQGWPEIIDDWLGAGVTNEVIARQNFVTNVPAATDWPAGSVELTNSANRNQIGVDPLFATDPGPGGGRYYLRQPPDTGNPFSPAVDYGLLPAASVDFGANPNYAGQTMAQRTTKPVSKTADLCFVDIGFHYPLGSVAVDSDSDTIPDGDELAIGTNPNDADTDDDGILDGVDCGPDLDGDGSIAALDCDTDGDGLPDGLELSVDGLNLSPDTDTTATCDTSNATCFQSPQLAFVNDTQPTTQTDPLNRDTDGGGESDGCEDLDVDGNADRPTPNPSDRDESNPNNAADDDADVDGLSNSLEGILTTDPLDRDTDDDGVTDGNESAPPPWLDGADPDDPSWYVTDPVNCDTDGDGISDGVERSEGPVTVPVDAEPGTRGTDCPASPVFCGLPTCFAPDADPRINNPGGGADLGSATWAYCATAGACEGVDTDGDGCLDGVEDANQNGRVDGGETSPLNGTDCSGGGILYLEAVTSRYQPGAGTCGPLTQPRESTLFTTPCTSPITTGCSAAQAMVTPTGTLTPGSVYTVTPGYPLVFFETTSCADIPYVCKSVTGTITVDVLPCP